MPNDIQTSTRTCWDSGGRPAATLPSRPWPQPTQFRSGSVELCRLLARSTWSATKSDLRRTPCSRRPIRSIRVTGRARNCRVRIKCPTIRSRRHNKFPTKATESKKQTNKIEWTMARKWLEDWLLQFYPAQMPLNWKRWLVDWNLNSKGPESDPCLWITVLEVGKWIILGEQTVKASHLCWTISMFKNFFWIHSVFRRLHMYRGTFNAISNKLCIINPFLRTFIAFHCCFIAANSIV